MSNLVPSTPPEISQGEPQLVKKSSQLQEKSPPQFTIRKVALAGAVLATAATIIGLGSLNSTSQ